MKRMTRTEADVTELVVTELSRFQDERLRAAFEQYLVRPTQRYRMWEWAPGALYPIWVVASFGHGGVGVAYADGGYGKMGKPWGLVLADATSVPTGTDDNWYPTLEECVKDSGHL